MSAVLSLKLLIIRSSESTGLCHQNELVYDAALQSDIELQDNRMQDLELLKLHKYGSLSHCQDSYQMTDRQRQLASTVYLRIFNTI